MEPHKKIWWYKLIFGVSIGVEVCALAVYGFGTYRYLRVKQNVLGASVVQLHKENLIYTPTSHLKYFYEYKPNIIQPDTVPGSGESVAYTFNSDALNERFNYPVTADPLTYRIITLGDSFTFGHFVNTADNWPERLEDMLNSSLCNNVNHVDVINLGLPGYDSEYDVERFIRRGLKYHPDLVIWFLHGDRWNELMTAKRLELEQTLTPQEIQKAEQEGNYNLSWEKAMEYVYATYSPIQLFEQQQAVFARFSRVYSGKLLVVSLPNADPLYRMRLKYFVYNRHQTYYSDDLPHLRQIQGVLPDGHPNVTGHTAIAKSVLGVLRQDKLIPCQSQ